MRFPAHPPERPAVVAGASSGIGEAIALALAEAGHPVALGARRVERCEEIAERIRDKGGRAVALELDLTDDASVERFAAEAVAAHGDVEVMVAAAGYAGAGLVHEASTDDVAYQLDVNVLGPHRLVRAFVAPMVERRRGDAVFISSDVAGRPRPRTAGYAASKRGLEGLVGAMQMELEGSGVRAVLVRPGQTLTEMGWSWPEEETTKVLEDWAHWGLARHSNFMRPAAIADPVVSLVQSPRGTYQPVVEIQPEAPVEDA